jgi:hypothetical protein
MKFFAEKVQRRLMARKNFIPSFRFIIPFITEKQVPETFEFPLADRGNFCYLSIYGKNRVKKEWSKSW